MVALLLLPGLNLFPLVERIQQRTGCRVSALTVTAVAPDTATVGAIVMQMAGDHVTLQRAPLVIAFTYVRVGAEWHRLPLIRVPKHSHAPCFVDAEWQHLSR